MDIESLRDYCLTKKGATEHFPFDEYTLVFKVGGKMFALTSLNKWEEGDHSVNLKCNPDKALLLREQYEGIVSGYHMNKKHWNTIYCNRQLDDGYLKKLIDHSYDLVFQSLPNRLKEETVSPLQKT